jgi:hypothetical protein
LLPIWLSSFSVLLFSRAVLRLSGVALYGIGASIYQLTNKACRINKVTHIDKGALQPKRMMHSLGEKEIKAKGERNGGRH